MAQGAVIDAKQHEAEARAVFEQAQREASENPSSSSQDRLDHAEKNLRTAKEALRLAQAREQRHALKHDVHLAQQELKREQWETQQSTSISADQRKALLRKHVEKLEAAKRAHLEAKRQNRHVHLRVRYEQSHDELQQAVAGTDEHAAAIIRHHRRSSALPESRRQKHHQRRAEAAESEAKLASEPDSPTLQDEVATRQLRLHRAHEKLAAHEHKHKHFDSQNRAVLSRHRQSEQERREDRENRRRAAEEHAQASAAQLKDEHRRRSSRERLHQHEQTVAGLPEPERVAHRRQFHEAESQRLQEHAAHDRAVQDQRRRRKQEVAAAKAARRQRADAKVRGAVAAEHEQQARRKAKSEQKASARAEKRRAWQDRQKRLAALHGEERARHEAEIEEEKAEKARRKSEAQSAAQARRQRRNQEREEQLQPRSTPSHGSGAKSKLVSARRRHPGHASGAESGTIPLRLAITPTNIRMSSSVETATTSRCRRRRITPHTRRTSNRRSTITSLATTSRRPSLPMARPIILPRQAPSISRILGKMVTPTVRPRAITAT
ncbi:hypothetical protein JCM8115_005151 [Rhodotorula mucilaginosa]